MAGTALPRQGRNLACMATRQMAARKEAEHKCYVERRNQEEERRARHNLRRRAIKKRELVETFRRRRLQNFVAEALVTGPTRARPQPPPSERDPHHHNHHPRLDDAPSEPAICKRNGFIWSDLGRTPKARLSLVVPPIAVKRDRECLERLLSTVEKEEVEARAGERRQRERIAAQHERWQLQASPPKARQAKIMAAIINKPKKPHKNAHNDSSGPSRSGEQDQDASVSPVSLKDNSKDTKNAEHVTMSRRLEKLSRPREPADLKTAYVMLGSTDLVGLLHAEPALRGMLKGHLDDLRQNLTAARFSKHGGPALAQPTVLHVESSTAAAAAGAGAASDGGDGRRGGGGGRGGGRGWR